MATLKASSKGDRERALRLDLEADAWVDKTMGETGKTFTNIVKEALFLYRLTHKTTTTDRTVETEQAQTEHY